MECEQSKTTNETKRNETKRNETKRTVTGLHHQVSERNKQRGISVFSAVIVLRLNFFFLRTDKACYRLYGPFLSVVRVRDERFFDRFDGEIAAEDTDCFTNSVLDRGGIDRVRGGGGGYIFQKSEHGRLTIAQQPKRPTPFPPCLSCPLARSALVVPVSFPAPSIRFHPPPSCPDNRCGSRAGSLETRRIAG